MADIFKNYMLSVDYSVMAVIVLSSLTSYEFFQKTLPTSKQNKPSKQTHTYKDKLLPMTKRDSSRILW